MRTNSAKTLSKLIAVVASAGFFVFGWAFRVLVLALKADYDRPLIRERYEETRTLLNAIYRSSEQDPMGRFPSALAEVTPFLQSMAPSVISASNSNAIYSRYVYLQPEPHRSGTVMPERVVLIEKLGHYKYEKGAHVGTVGNVVGYYTISDYKSLAARNSIPLERLSIAGGK